MIDFNELTKSLANCACGRPHTSGIEGVYIESGLTARTGELLKKHGFAKKLLVVADKNTLAAAEGIIDALSGFDTVYHVYDNKREPYYDDVEQIAALSADTDGVLSVGTGTLNDICRLACRLSGKRFAIFATAPSMDGFASSSAPIVKNGFKSSYDAVQSAVIIADTKVLADAPAHLKAAGFGDMMGKFIGIVDWRVSSLLTGEYFCEAVAELTLKATRRIFSIADRVQCRDESAAADIMECLLLTGLGMGYTGNSRPASGTEHIISHYLDIKQLDQHIQPDYHGFQVGVATLTMAERYFGYARHKAAKSVPDKTDWPAVYAAYGSRFDEEIRSTNVPPVTDEVKPGSVEQYWPDICRIITDTLPTPTELRRAMTTAGCPVDYAGIGVSRALYDEAVAFHPYMRRRMTLERLMPCIEF